MGNIFLQHVAGNIANSTSQNIAVMSKIQNLKQHIVPFIVCCVRNLSSYSRRWQLRGQRIIPIIFHTERWHHKL